MDDSSLMDDRESQQGILQGYNPYTQGLSLIELLIAISIISIVISLAVPGFRDAIARHRVNAQTQQLYTSLILARSEAVKRGVPVTVCPRVFANAGCLTDFKRWETGWLLFLDGNDDDVVDTGEEIIRFYDQADGLQIHWNRKTPLTYNAKGFLSGSSAGTFTLCDPALVTVQPHTVIISMNGRPRVGTISVGKSSPCHP